jgi:hypothetical protein
MPSAGRLTRDDTEYQCQTTDSESALRSGASSRNSAVGGQRGVRQQHRRRRHRGGRAAQQREPHASVSFALQMSLYVALRAYSDLVAGNVAIYLQGVRLGRVGWGASAFLVRDQGIVL